MEDEGAGFAADESKGGGRFLVDVGEHEATVGGRLPLLGVGGVEDLVDAPGGEGVGPYHGANFGGKLGEGGEGRR